jgi:hypothetical protein
MHIGYWWENRKGKIPLRRPRPRWEDNTKMDFQDIRCGSMNLIYPAQNTD